MSTRQYWTAVGTEHERLRKPYTTPAGAKGWVSGKVEDFKEWCDRFNHALGEEVSEIRKEVLNYSLITMPPGQHQEWRMKDEHTGFTLVVELWVEVTE